MDIDKLFAQKSEADAFMDVIIALLDEATLKKIFGLLPKRTQDTAFCWGLSDTVFRDAAYTFLEDLIKNKL